MQRPASQAHPLSPRQRKAARWATIGLAAMALGALAGVARLVTGEASAFVILMTVLYVVGAASFALLRHLLSTDSRDPQNRV